MYTLKVVRTTQTTYANSNTVVLYSYHIANVVFYGPQLYCGSCASLEMMFLSYKMNFFEVYVRFYS